MFSPHDDDDDDDDDDGDVDIADNTKVWKVTAQSRASQMPGTLFSHYLLNRIIIYIKMIING